MKCKDCKYFIKPSLDEIVLDIKIASNCSKNELIEYVGRFCKLNIFNASNNCLEFKRKWYKFWIKN